MARPLGMLAKKFIAPVAPVVDKKIQKVDRLTVRIGRDPHMYNFNKRMNHILATGVKFCVIEGG